MISWKRCRRSISRRSVSHQAEVSECFHPSDDLPGFVQQDAGTDADGDLLAIGPKDGDRAIDNRLSRFQGILQNTPGFTHIGSENLAARTADRLGSGDTGDLLRRTIEERDFPVEVHGKDSVRNAVQNDLRLGRQVGSIHQCDHQVVGVMEDLRLPRRASASKILFLILVIVIDRDRSFNSQTTTTKAAQPPFIPSGSRDNRISGIESESGACRTGGIFSCRTRGRRGSPGCSTAFCSRATGNEVDRESVHGRPQAPHQGSPPRREGFPAPRDSP